MANSKKSSRSSRGRSNYVKQMQRSVPKQKRLRKGDLPVQEQSSGRVEERLSSPIKGMITGGFAGMVVGVVFNMFFPCVLGGIVIGGVLGCVFDLVKRRLEERKTNKK